MKHLLITILLATVVIPVVASRDPNPRRGAVRMVLYFLLFNLVYVGYVTLIHATYVLPPVP